jgi:thiamine-monophosphate kinase
MKLKELGEFRFIDRIMAGCLVRKEGVIKAIGDDCCVFRTPENRVTLLTTDMLVEDIHFLRHAITPYELGRKSLAVNISDIAAMGGIPGEAVISIAIPGTIEVEYLDQLYEGMKSMARQFDVNLLGGDTTSSPQHLVINVALVGWAQEDEVLYRSGAKAGDVIFLTGAVGTSAAGLDLILSGKKFSHRDTLLEAHHNPLPQIKEGRIIAGVRVANSLIDVSDGVASDLGHICDESGVGALLEESRIPVTDAFRVYCSEFSLDVEKLMLHVGEDYVLLGSVPAESADKLRNALESAGSSFHPIGTIVGGSGITLRGSDGSTREIAASGFDHFRK